MTSLDIRTATVDDVPAIVAMLADDPLGATRETPDDLGPYLSAFAAIDADPNNHLVVADRDGQVLGTLQLTIIPGLARTGMGRGLIEAVRIHADARGMGLGETMVRWAIERSRELGCGLVQLTTDITRTDAHRFYERVGFDRTHYGYKLSLT
ncbi:GNAT family N-acetyltransferase [Stackebrandtia soli]|uniref:GNAT family N-acetyltransferase n=1 Tax=Stackebrandtia soli TaxID=1892856 RepID=UPI0039ED2EC5